MLRKCGEAHQKSLVFEHRISDNVVPVKYFVSVLTRALRGARHFALVEAVPYQPKARSQSVSGQELSPTHASLRSTTSIMITTSNSPVQRERTLNQLLGALLVNPGGTPMLRRDRGSPIVLAPYPLRLNNPTCQSRDTVGAAPQT